MMAAAAWLAGTAALAHSWYPSECCSSQDCRPADRVSTDDYGDYDVVVGLRHVRVPRAFTIRPSADGRAHICYVIDNYGAAQPLCLFLPVQA